MKKIVDPGLIGPSAVFGLAVIEESDSDLDEFLERNTNIGPFHKMVAVSGVKSRSEKEAYAIYCLEADYVLLCTPQTLNDYEMVRQAASHFQDPNVGAILFPARFGDHPHAGEEWWRNSPIFFRTLAYQQTKGSVREMQELGWEVVQGQRMFISKQSDTFLRDPEDPPNVTIFTPIDAGKRDLIHHYFDKLGRMALPAAECRLIIWGDTKTVEHHDYIRQQINLVSHRFHEVTIVKAIPQTWMEMGEDYYRWPGVKHPVSVRVATIYNEMLKRVSTDQVLLWECDTIPITDNFLLQLRASLGPLDAGISGHYVDKETKKSLAWDFHSTIPFDYSWHEPKNEGVEYIDGVPHGMLLLNKEQLDGIRFSVLANDARDFRGPDLMMCRDLQLYNRPIKIDWGVKCKHYTSPKDFLCP